MSAAVSAKISAVASATTLQALQYTRPFSVAWCKLCLLHLEPPHRVWILLLCGHYSRAGLILLSSARVRSAGSIRGREEIQYLYILASYVYASTGQFNKHSIMCVHVNLVKYPTFDTHKKTFIDYFERIIMFKMPYCWTFIRCIICTTIASFGNHYGWLLCLLSQIKCFGR